MKKLMPSNSDHSHILAVIQRSLIPLSTVVIVLLIGTQMVYAQADMWTFSKDVDRMTDEAKQLSAASPISGAVPGGEKDSTVIIKCVPKDTHLSVSLTLGKFDEPSGQESIIPVTYRFDKQKAVTRSWRNKIYSEWYEIYGDHAIEFARQAAKGTTVLFERGDDGKIVEFSLKGAERALKNVARGGCASLQFLIAPSQE